ncbi:microfibril-associated glycoprotein 4-like [Anopheles albimanus]|uniref:Fibrinogen C-terminal domain-containing protein n=1 Tax=Anopheles albimanus TaxID=7167 RepID=A0A8W7K7Q3_ANOAL|nr:microfibril-associated glycoprotein 4-like [Anopheles albimanus]
MKLSVCFLLICAFVYARAIDNSFDTAEGALGTVPVEAVLGYMLEMMLDKFDGMDRKLSELQIEQKELRKEMERNRLSQEDKFKEFVNDVDRNMSVLQNRSVIILEQQKSCANHDRLRERLFNYIAQQNASSYKTLEHTFLSIKSRNSDCITPTSSSPKIDSTTPTTLPKISTITPRRTELPTYASCKDAPANASGVYLIQVNNASLPFNVYCEMEKFEGGWIVIQHRFDGSVDFYQNWDQYRDGFGELDSEFWLGLEHIHQLTIARTHVLIVEVKDFSGNYGYARYNEFQIGSDREQYRLKSLGSYSGTAGDSLIDHKDRKFSTKDRDNDERSDYHLATIYEGGWWHNGGRSNLNGRYKNADRVKSNFWVSFQAGNRGLSFSRMMIREI